MSLTFNIIDTGSVDRAVSAFRIIDPGSVDRVVIEGRIIGPDGADRVFYDTTGASSFAITANHGTVSGHGNATAITNSVTVTPTGGTAPYFYAWTLIAHSSGTNPTIGSAAAATTTFTQTNIGAGDYETATFRCTVTDSAAGSATIDVDAVFVDTSLL